MPVAPANDHRLGAASGPVYPTLTNPLVVFTSGLGLNEDEWEPVRTGLAGPSLVLLLLSMGRPAPRHADLRVEAQATRLLQLLPTRVPIVLVAHSASCPVAVEVATRSEDVVGLVLVGPVTDPAAASWPAIMGQWSRTAVHERLWEVPTLLRQWWRTGLFSMLRGMNAVRHFRTDLALKAVTIPVEIVRGDTDRIAAQVWASSLQTICSGTLTVVEGSAHMVPSTNPKAVTAAVNRIREILPQMHEEFRPITDADACLLSSDD